MMCALVGGDGNGKGRETVNYNRRLSAVNKRRK